MTRKVQLFVTCMIETLRPEAGIAVVEILERLGVSVEIPKGQTCCGQPAFNGGLWDDARAIAKHTLDVLHATEGDIIVPSGSCGDMIKHHYTELLASDAVYGKCATEVAARTYEFAQYLVDVLGVTDLHAQFNGTLAYHPSCHLLRSMRVDRQPCELLSHVQGAHMAQVEDAEECCGFGGLFSVKMGDISSAMLERKLDRIIDSGAQTVVGCDVSCLINISGGLHRRGSNIETKHIAEVLNSVIQRSDHYQ